MIRLILPSHLRTLAGIVDEVMLEVGEKATQRTILDALERRYPMLAGTIRDHVTLVRRPYIRFFGCGEDLSNEPPDSPVPEAVSSGREPYLIVGSLAGG